ncbi:hypothetical protein GC093_03945 [Paenibacillus sp. LMG 31456]|uniref:PepSY domain-containing protein n=1 Tax=Paenibacillus foliorum TaxID=2654974 RepID=A0A972GLU1_9BACL|nr:PepSY domain-containing protein [Paenibacillus foliorum]NOU92390.1 hypothetical protein [Paenibacillus foliorum]
MTKVQAGEIALQKVNGTIIKAQLEDEDGTAVYSVIIKDSKNETMEVKVDASTGTVVKVEQDNQYYY